MRYQGGKHASAAMIARAIAIAGRGKARYVEPLLGGASVLAALHKIRPDLPAHASDIHPDLIALYRAVADGWDPPTTIDIDTYTALKTADPSALRGFAGFAASFGAQWFTGYGRGDVDTVAATRNWLLANRAALAHAALTCTDYRTVAVGPTDVVYADPPYGETYRYLGTDPFDTDIFWRTATGWVQAGAVVLVSEYNAPPGWIATRTRHRPNRLRMQQKGTGVSEMLYRSPDENVQSLNVR